MSTGSFLIGEEDVRVDNEGEHSMMVENSLELSAAVGNPGFYRGW
jgi:hypothetical protein